MNESPSEGEVKEDAEGSGALEDGTLGGYLRHHQRPPAFEGVDGHPYTVSVEIEKTPDLRAPFSGYLVFPQWADSGAGIIGHLETPILTRGKSRDEVTAELGSLTLHLYVRNLLQGVRYTVS